MKIVIETSLKNDTNNEADTFSAILDMDELASLVSKHGLESGNKALDGFIGKYVAQLKEKFGKYVNK
jgi:hypothetical protein